MPTESRPSIQAHPDPRLFYSRCPGVPTSSNLAVQLGLLDAEMQDDLSLGVKFECATAAHVEERYWLRHSSHVNAAWDKATGVDSHVIAFSWLEGSYPIFVPRQGPVRSVSDLHGRRLAVLKNQNVPMDVWRIQNLKTYEAALTSAGFSLRDVELIDVERPIVAKGFRKGQRQNVFADASRDLVNALVRGEADAIAASLPPEVADFLDLKEIYNSRQHPDAVLRVNPSVLRCLVVSGALLREHRDLVVRILSRLLEAAEWALKNPDEAVRLLAKDLNTSEEALLSVYENISHGMQIDASEGLIAALHAQKSFLLNNNFIQEDFDLTGWVDTGPLAEARALLAKRKAANRITLLG